MTESIRLAKRVVDLMACSRREAEIYIEGGWVSVDGAVGGETGFRVDQAQAVALLPKATLVPAAPVTILMHKPAGVALTDAAGGAVALIEQDDQIADDRSGIG